MRSDRTSARPLAGTKVERDAVHAIALPGRLRSVVEDVTEMAATTAAMDFGSGHQKAPVGLGFDRPVERRPETRPAGPAVELGICRKQRLAAAGAAINAVAVLLVERARTGAFGSVLAKHPILGRGQSAPPLLLALRYGERLCRRFAAAAQPAEQTFRHDASPNARSDPSDIG